MTQPTRLVGSFAGYFTLMCLAFLRHQLCAGRRRHGLGRGSTNGLSDRRKVDEDRDMDLRIQCLSIYTTDPARLADFWQSALGWRRTHEDDGEVVLEPQAGPRGRCRT
jgi:hypothetical protein